MAKVSLKQDADLVTAASAWELAQGKYPDHDVQRTTAAFKYAVNDKVAASILDNLSASFAGVGKEALAGRDLG